MKCNARKETVREEVPERVAEVVLARVRPLIRIACLAENIIEAIALNCYLQGVLDGRELPVTDRELKRVAAADAHEVEP